MSKRKIQYNDSDDEKKAKAIAQSQKQLLQTVVSDYIQENGLEQREKKRQNIAETLSKNVEGFQPASQLHRLNEFRNMHEVTPFSLPNSHALLVLELNSYNADRKAEGKKPIKMSTYIKEKYVDPYSGNHTPYDELRLRLAKEGGLGLRQLHMVGKNSRAVATHQDLQKEKNVNVAMRKLGKFNSTYTDTLFNLEKHFKQNKPVFVNDPTNHLYKHPPLDPNYSFTKALKKKSATQALLKAKACRRKP